MEKICHIIVAAGSGSRFGAGMPKQYCNLGKRPVLMETIERFEKCGLDSDIVLVLNSNFIDYWSELCHRYDFESPTVVEGGATRWDSVCNAVKVLSDEVEVVTVHDGARPLVSQTLIEAVVNGVYAGADGVLPSVAVTDSLRRVSIGGQSESVDRSEFRAIQTPQAFRASVLRKAYLLPYSSSFTDDASVVEAAGYKNLKLVEGEKTNIKITSPGDIEIAELYMRSSK